MQKYKTPRKAVITDAGFASRFLPITKTIPKAMVPIGSKPIMQMVVEECQAAGIQEIIIVATKDGKKVYEDYFNNPVEHIKKLLVEQGKEDRYGSVKDVLNLPKIIVIEQDPRLPYGNGSPVASAKDYLENDEAFIVMFSDDLVIGASDAKALVSAYEKNPDAKAVIMAQEMPKEELSKYGVISLKSKTKKTLSHIVEKPKPEDAPSNLTSYGRYLLTPEVFDFLIPNNIGMDDELWLVDAITKMAKNGDVLVEKTKGQWATTGDPKNYLFAHIKYALKNEEFSEEIRNIIKNN